VESTTTTTPTDRSPKLLCSLLALKPVFITFLNILGGYWSNNSGEMANIESSYDTLEHEKLCWYLTLIS